MTGNGLKPFADSPRTSIPRAVRMHSPLSSSGPNAKGE